MSWPKERGNNATMKSLDPLASPGGDGVGGARKLVKESKKEGRRVGQRGSAKSRKIEIKRGKQKRGAEPKGWGSNKKKKSGETNGGGVFDW